MTAMRGEHLQEGRPSAMPTYLATTDLSDARTGASRVREDRFSRVPRLERDPPAAAPFLTTPRCTRSNQRRTVYCLES